MKYNIYFEEEEDAIAPVGDTPDTTDINSETGGVTPNDVADVLHLSKPTEPAPEEPVAPGKPTEPEKVEETSQAPTPPVPTPPVNPETPSFSIEIEDVNGKKFTVSPGDNLESVLAEFEPKTNGQVIQLMSDLARLENDKKVWESEQETQATEAEKAETVANIQTGWDKEIASLQGQKRLTLGADGKSERINQVFKFMSDENTKRVESGVPLIQSFEDALDKLELNERREADKEADKAAKEESRRRGSLVGGSSAPASSGAPVYRAGAARSASDAIRVMGLLK